MLIFKIIIPFLLALAVVAAADYLYHPTIEIHSHLSESDIHKLKGELQEKGITLETVAQIVRDHIKKYGL